MIEYGPHIQRGAVRAYQHDVHGHRPRVRPFTRIGQQLTRTRRRPVRVGFDDFGISHAPLRIKRAQAVQQDKAQPGIRVTAMGGA